MRIFTKGITFALSLAAIVVSGLAYDAGRYGLRGAMIFVAFLLIAASLLQYLRE